MKSFVNKKVLFLFTVLIVALAISILLSLHMSKHSRIENLEDEVHMIPKDTNISSKILFPPLHKSALYTLHRLHSNDEKVEDHKDETINDLFKDTIVETKVVPELIKLVKDYQYNPTIYYPIQDFQDSVLKRPLDRFKKSYPNSRTNIDTVERIVFNIMFHTYSEMKAGRHPDYHKELHKVFALKVEKPIQSKKVEAPHTVNDKTRECRFNAKEYSNRYADLQKAFHGDERKLKEHWLKHGIYEGRSPCGNIDARCRFDANAYSNIYPDLQKAFRGNKEQLKHHYLTYGIHEGRMVCNSNEQPPPYKKPHHKWIWSDGKDGKYKRGYHWVTHE